MIHNWLYLPTCIICWSMRNIFSPQIKSFGKYVAELTWWENESDLWRASLAQAFYTVAPRISVNEIMYNKISWKNSVYKTLGILFWIVLMDWAVVSCRKCSWKTRIYYKHLMPRPHHVVNRNLLKSYFLQKFEYYYSPNLLLYYHQQKSRKEQESNAFM